MTVRLSTGLAAAMLGNYGLTAMMGYGVIDVYSGDQPVSPDLPPTGDLLGQITTDGNAFVVGSQGGGALGIEQSETGVINKVGTWTLSGFADGTAGWWRWRWNSYDSGQASFYFPRVDGLIGNSLQLADTTISAATSVDIDNFTIRFRG